jgi:hypothetical protein
VLFLLALLGFVVLSVASSCATARWLARRRVPAPLVVLAAFGAFFYPWAAFLLVTQVFYPSAYRVLH